MIIKFASSNKLILNPQKTHFVLFRHKQPIHLRSILIGDVPIHESTEIKILGLTLNNDLNWKKHLEILSSTLRSRLFLLRKLSRKLPRQCLLAILDGFFMSRIRYGLAVFGQPSPLSDSSQLKRIQVLLNAAMRIATGTRLSDKIRITVLMEMTKLPSINQACHLAITLTTKCILDHDIIPEMKEALTKDYTDQDRVMTRSQTRKDLITQPTMRVRCRSFSYFAAQLWNKLPIPLRNGHHTSTKFRKEAKAYFDTNCHL